MALGLRIASANFQKYVSQVPPAAVSDAQVLLLPGTNAASSKKNWAAEGAPDATVIGAPVYDAGYAVLSGNDGFEAAGGPGNGSFTYITVQTAVLGNDGSLGFMGRWVQGVAAQDMLYALAGASTLALAVDGAKRAELARPGLDSEFRFHAGRFDGSTAKLSVSSAGELLASSAAYAGGAAASEDLRIGATGFFSATSSGTFRCAAAIGWNRSLTDAEIQSVYSYLDGLMSRRGITVS